MSVLLYACQYVDCIDCTVYSILSFIVLLCPLVVYLCGVCFQFCVAVSSFYCVFCFQKCNGTVVTYIICCRWYFSCYSVMVTVNLNNTIGIENAVFVKCAGSHLPASYCLFFSYGCGYRYLIFGTA